MSRAFAVFRIFAIVAAMSAAPSFAADKTLKVIAHADLKVLDTTANTTYITNRYGYLVYDTLFGMDSKFVPQPQMVETYTVSDDRLTWTFKLRPGQKFHDGAPVVAADAVASLKRWMARDGMGQTLAARTAAFEAVDDDTFKLVLTEPYALVLETFGRWGVPPFVMPARVANAPLTEPVTSSVGSASA